MSGSSRRLPLFVGAVIFLLLGVPALAWALRGTIATSMARGELEARGLDCDARFAVALSAGLGEATIGPTRCTSEGGIVETIELLGDLTIELEGTTPRSIQAESVRIALRANDVRGGSGWAQPLRRLDVEQRVAGLVKGLAEVGAMELPPVTATTVEVVRGGGVVATARSLALGGGEPATVRAQQIAFSAGPAGVGRLTLSRVTGSANAGRVQLQGRADATAGFAILSVSRGGQFRLDATGLDSAAPAFTLGGDF